MSNVGFIDKDAYYFPHFSNARHDRKVKRLRKELGLEGYGIYFMLLEVLRDQEDFTYPMDDIDLLADEFGTSEQKVGVVISNYSLFKINNQECFFSPKLIEFLMPYLNQKQSRRIDGIKGNLIRHGHYTKDQLKGLADEQILELNRRVKSMKTQSISGGNSQGESGGENLALRNGAFIPKQSLEGIQSGGESRGDRNKSKVKESKVKEKRENTRASDDFSRINEIPVPKELQYKEFYETYGNYINYMLTEKAVDVTPIKTELHIAELIRLKNQGNDPVKVIKQTIMSDNKSFYPLKSKQFDGQKEEANSNLPIYKEL